MPEASPPALAFALLVAITAAVALLRRVRSRGPAPEAPLPEPRSEGGPDPDLLLRNRLLAYERDRYRSVLDAIPDGVVVTDATGVPVHANRTATSWLTGHPAGDPSLDGADLTDAVRSLGAATRPGESELTFDRPDGVRHVRARRQSLAEGRGEVIVLRDATQQRAATEAQAAFLSQISHELKSPLNTIVTYVEALADTDLMDREERGQLWNDLNAEAHRMARLIGNLLQISRIELGDLSVRAGFVKPAPLLHELVAAVAPQAGARNLTLETHVPQTLAPVTGDKDLLGVCISNLLSNAVKYTEPGGRIELRADASGDGLLVEVADTGIGIPPAERERVFERFVRSSQPEVLREPGSGLGLALVKEIVRLHDGTLEVAAAEPRGTIFRVWLPGRVVTDRPRLEAA